MKNNFGCQLNFGHKTNGVVSMCSVGRELFIADWQSGSAALSLITLIGRFRIKGKTCLYKMFILTF
ncbi:MAG: hypothetical protein CVU54_02115 [Deltaproteobacteria bacterium HGW-Deltaproteobacteria-12]|nr:MAG: hypothetical protein CVU54_02115 [Deltaproteobacteria bacterium HGW-Deltaproteobacteria-12]